VKNTSHGAYKIVKINSEDLNIQIEAKIVDIKA
jgi:hypothetical protein